MVFFIQRSVQGFHGIHGRELPLTPPGTLIADKENPLQAVYFVDVQIVRVADKIVAYRVIGYHGKEEIDELDATSLA